MLPVLVDGDWQVEAVIVDLGSGLREWIEIRNETAAMYVSTVADRDRVLRAHGVNPARLIAVDTIDDGCE